MLISTKKDLFQLNDESAVNLIRSYDVERKIIIITLKRIWHRLWFLSRCQERTIYVVCFTWWNLFIWLLIYSRTQLVLPNFLFSSLVFMCVQQEQLGDVHLCLLGGCCYLMLVLRAHVLTDRTSVHPAGMQSSLCARCLWLPQELCRSRLHSVVP